ncbi:hypothetical protein D3C87_1078470 [compost metagenome]
MSTDYAMMFERTVKKVFGNPKTQIYFAGFYDTNEYAFKAMLFAMCTYEINYHPEKYDEESLNILKEFETKAYRNETSRDEDLKFLIFLNEYENN